MRSSSRWRQRSHKVLWAVTHVFNDHTKKEKPTAVNICCCFLYILSFIYRKCFIMYCMHRHRSRLCFTSSIMTMWCFSAVFIEPWLWPLKWKPACVGLSGPDIDFGAVRTHGCLYLGTVCQSTELEPCTVGWAVSGYVEGPRAATQCFEYLSFLPSQALSVCSL